MKQERERVCVFEASTSQGLTQMGCDARMMDSDARAATVQTIAGHMEDALEIQREVTDREACGLCMGRRLGSYVTCLYVFIKLLYLLNVVGQIFLLNTFLGTGNLLYGFPNPQRPFSRAENGRSPGNFPPRYHVRLRGQGTRQRAPPHCTVCAHDQHVQ